MYLMLYTQGVDSEIGTAYDRFQMSNKGDVIQTDIKLNKGQVKWRSRYDVEPSGPSFDFNTGLGILRGMSQEKSHGWGYSYWDDLYSIGLEGLSGAYQSWDSNKDNYFKAYVRQCIKNAFYGEFRKHKRWEKEEPFLKHNYENDFRAGAGKEYEYGDSFDCTPFEDRISAQESVSEGQKERKPSMLPLWMEPTPNQEDTIIHKEETEMAHEKVASLVKHLNERELYVFWNHIVTDEPMTLREIASQFQCHYSSINRDAKRIRKQLAIEEKS